MEDEGLLPGGPGTLTVAETRAFGTVSGAVYRGYLRAFGTVPELLLTVFLFLAHLTTTVLLNLWLAGFTDPPLLTQLGIPTRVVENYTVFVGVYLSLTGILLVLEGTRFLALALLCVQASKHLFHNIYFRLLLAKLSWFDQTPLGRIVNRCSADTNITDQMITKALSTILGILLSLFSGYIILLISSPVLLAPMVVVGLIYFWIQGVYRRASIQLQRLESLARSPLYSLISETFVGLVTIRGFDRSDAYLQQIQRHINLVVRTSWPAFVMNRWLSLRLSALAILIVVAVVVLAVAGRNVLLVPSLAGLVLSQVLTTTNLYSWIISQLVLVETTINAAERILEYGEPTQAEVDGERESEGAVAGETEPPTGEGKDRGTVDGEAEPTAGGGEGEEPEDQAPPDSIQDHHRLWRCWGHQTRRGLGIIPLEPPQVVPDIDGPLKELGWPASGEIRFVDLEFRYRPELEPSLRGVNLTIPAGHKVGVVGKTGSGKSTLLKALLRVAEASSGQVVVDGVATSRVGLSLLRQSITYVPQTPVIFRGTVRSNLDWAQRSAELSAESGCGSGGVGVLTDEELWGALEAVQIAETVRDLPGGLDSELSGSELSVGEKQLLCFARCLLHGGKIVCLDEATASIDLHSDVLIQQALRTHFRDRTVVAIAHRLDTIIDSDMVVVMQEGRVGECGPPCSLLDQSDSLFSQLVGETGEHGEVLRTAARRAAAGGGFGSVNYGDLIGGAEAGGPGPPMPRSRGHFSSLHQSHPEPLYTASTTHIHIQSLSHMLSDIRDPITTPIPIHPIYP